VLLLLMQRCAAAMIYLHMRMCCAAELGCFFVHVDALVLFFTANLFL
jgi:hypothetical protein